MQEYTVVMLLSVIVKAEDEDEAVRKAGLPFQLGLVPQMGKMIINAVRPTHDGDRDPIDPKFFK